MSQHDSFNDGAGGAGEAGGLSPDGVGPAGRNGALARAAHTGDLLSEHDAAALDALVESGWDARAVASEHGPRAARIARILGVIDAAGPAHHDEALEDVVLLRVARLRAAAPPHIMLAPASQRDSELSTDDGRTLDLLIDSGLEPASLDLRDAQRARRQIGLLSLLDTSPGTVDERERRIEAALLAVQRSVEDQQRRMQTESGGGRSRIQFADLVSVAALLLIGSAVLFSIMDGVRASGQRAACQTAMHAAGIGFGQYAASSRDMLPMASASNAGSPWWDVGGRPERSNSANLFTLTRTGYASLADLACVGNPAACRTESQAGEMDWRKFADVSYSYRMMFGRASDTLAQSPTAVLMSDRSTMLMIRPGVLQVRVFDNSPNHGGRGQSVLLADGSVRWLESPVFKNGDNLWLPGSLENALKRLIGPVAEPKPLTGTETPGGLEDHFVAP